MLETLSPAAKRRGLYCIHLHDGIVLTCCWAGTQPTVVVLQVSFRGDEVYQVYFLIRAVQRCVAFFEFDLL